MHEYGEYVPGQGGQPAREVEPFWSPDDIVTDQGEAAAAQPVATQGPQLAQSAHGQASWTPPAVAHTPAPQVTTASHSQVTPDVSAHSGTAVSPGPTETAHGEAAVPRPRSPQPTTPSAQSPTVQQQLSTSQHAGTQQATPQQITQPAPMHQEESPWSQPPRTHHTVARGQARPPTVVDPTQVSAGAGDATAQAAQTSQAGSSPQQAAAHQTAAHQTAPQQTAPQQTAPPPTTQPPLAPQQTAQHTESAPTPGPSRPSTPGPVSPVSPTPGPVNPTPTPGPSHPGPTHPNPPHPGPTHPRHSGTAEPTPNPWPSPHVPPQPHVGGQVPPPSYPPTDGGVYQVPTQAVRPAYTDQPWTPEPIIPTAEEFARRRAARPADPVATMGVRAVVNKSTFGLVKLPPSRHEQEIKRDIEMVRRNFGGLRQVTIVNPKGGAGKTVATLLLAMTFGQKRGGYVLAWDNNETQGTLGMRAQQDFHSRTVRDLLRDLHQFQGAQGRVGDLSQYVRAQGEGMFDVLASDESATAGEMLTATAFAEIREVVSRFYKLIFVDTGNNVRAENWQAAIDATDQLVVTMSARNDSAETAARMLDHLEQTGRQRLVRQAVTVVSMPPSRRDIDLPPIQQHFAARTRAVLLAPYERLIDTGEPIQYGQLSSNTRDAWLKIAAAVAEGL